MSNPSSDSIRTPDIKNSDSQYPFRNSRVEEDNKPDFSLKAFLYETPTSPSPSPTSKTPRSYTMDPDSEQPQALTGTAAYVQPYKFVLPFPFASINVTAGPSELESAGKPDLRAEFKSAHKGCRMQKTLGTWPPAVENPSEEEESAGKIPFRLRSSNTLKDINSNGLVEEEDIEPLKLSPLPMYKYAPSGYFQYGRTTSTPIDHEHINIDSCITCIESSDFFELEYAYLSRVEKGVKSLYTSMLKCPLLSGEDKEEYLKQANHVICHVKSGIAHLPIFSRADWRGTAPYHKVMALARLHDLIYQLLVFVRDEVKDYHPDPLPCMDILEQDWLESEVVKQLKDQNEKGVVPGMKGYEDASGIITRLQQEQTQKERDFRVSTLTDARREMRARNLFHYKDAMAFCKMLQRPELAEYRKYWDLIVEVDMNATVEGIANFHQY